jgi:hypothetical protein
MGSIFSLVAESIRLAAHSFIRRGGSGCAARQTLLLKALVAEKELRLREGMQMMGLQSSMYWISWFTTHFSTLLLTMVACTLISTSQIRP